MFDSGKGKRYFFVNYERYHLNEVSPTPRAKFSRVWRKAANFITAPAVRTASIF
jgi:hypothetical protein